MSKPPIYPKGFDPDYTIHVKVFEAMPPIAMKGQFQTEWPYMLGLLTIIGDAVRGVPWGKPAEPESNWCADLPLGDCIPVVTPKGAVRLAYKRRSMDKPYPSEHMVTVAGPDGEVYHRVVADGWPSLARIYRPATVIPTDEYQAMQERLDGISDLEKRYSELRSRAARLELEAKWLAAGSAAISESVANCTVIPTPTADAWRRLEDPAPHGGEPAADQLCAWWNENSAAAGIHFDRYDPLAFLDSGWWWQPVPPGVIPPPPANRDGEAS